jgi:putative transposase
MPYKNQSTKIVENVIYHVYARGINKMRIFRDLNDYRFFFYLLKKYLSPNFKQKKIIFGVEISIPVNSVYDLVALEAFCLMPNHFHLLLLNLKVDGVTKLMRRVLSNYSAYYNKKYNRQGPVIQGSFRSVAVTDEWYLLTLGVYIHVNALKAGLVTNLMDYPFSSYQNYRTRKETSWLKLNPVLENKLDFVNLQKDLKKIDIIGDSEKYSLGLL